MTAHDLSPSQVVRFWTRFTTTEAGCMEWKQHRDQDGYGRVKVNGRDWGAHRLAYSIAHGQIPPGMSVLHSCDNPPCGNPAHLSVGTALENNRDSAAKNRSAIRRYPDRYGGKPGEANGIAKLTDDGVRDIRRRYAAGGISQQKLADEYGVLQSTVGRIVLRRSWTHVD